MTIKKMFIAAALLLAQQIQTMDNSGAQKANQEQQPIELTEQEKMMANAGQFSQLGFYDGSPRDTICSYLPLRDIVQLRKTCRVLKNVWNNERIMMFDGDNTPYQIPGQNSLSRGLDTATDSSMTPDQKLSASIAFLARKLAGCRNLVELDFSQSNITALPVEIRNLTRLRRLNVFGNNLTQEVITNICTWLPNLEELILCDNNLTVLPEAIKNLTKLTYLNLEGNQFTPEAVAKICTWLPHLQELELSGNSLVTLPEEVKNLNHLRRLYLDANSSTLETKNIIRSWLPNTEITYYI